MAPAPSPPLTDRACRPRRNLTSPASRATTSPKSRGGFPEHREVDPRRSLQDGPARQRQVARPLVRHRLTTRFIAPHTSAFCLLNLLPCLAFFVIRRIIGSHLATLDC